LRWAVRLLTLAKGKTVTGRIWTYVRDDRPFGRQAPPAAVCYASRDRRGEHRQRHLQNFTGILQADAYNGLNALFEAERQPTLITPAFCWAHSRSRNPAVSLAPTAPVGVGSKSRKRCNRSGCLNRHHHNSQLRLSYALKYRGTVRMLTLGGLSPQICGLHVWGREHGSARAMLYDMSALK
jgi:hypothetical protein